MYESTRRIMKQRLDDDESRFVRTKGLNNLAGTLKRNEIPAEVFTPSFAGLQSKIGVRHYSSVRVSLVLEGLGHNAVISPDLRSHRRLSIGIVSGRIHQWETAIYVPMDCRNGAMPSTPAYRTARKKT